MQRSYNLITQMANFWAIDLLCFVQPGVWTGIYDNSDEALAAARPALEHFCRSVTFIPLASPKGTIKRYLFQVVSVISSYPHDVHWLSSDEMRATIRRVYAQNLHDLVHFDTIGLAQYRGEIAGAPVTLTHHNIESHMLRRRAEHTQNPLTNSFFLREANKMEAYERRYATAFSLNVTCSSTSECMPPTS